MLFRFFFVSIFIPLLRLCGSDPPHRVPCRVSDGRKCNHPRTRCPDNLAIFTFHFWHEALCLPLWEPHLRTHACWQIDYKACLALLPLKVHRDVAEGRRNGSSHPGKVAELWGNKHLCIS